VATSGSKRLGAERIIILGRHADRTMLARESGATDVVSERGDEAVAKVLELTDASAPRTQRFQPWRRTPFATKHGCQGVVGRLAAASPTDHAKPIASHNSLLR
jgi:threonine dehydrogenase-like Zn-dependent dehydrogenase